MKKLFRDFVRGARGLPGYGNDSAGAIVILMTFLGVLAGMGRGDWVSALIGGAVMFAIFFPLYVTGCIGVARDYDAAIARRKAKAPP